MKKKFVKAIACVLSAVLIAGITATPSMAAERSYTYNYDYWGDVQDSPDLYLPATTLTSADLGLEKPMTSPQGLAVIGDDMYVCDTGNNRIIKLRRESADTLRVSEIIDSVKGASNNTFLQPTDIAQSEDGNFFICDKGNSRIIKTDENFNFIMEFAGPIDSSLPKDYVFAPNKVVVDSAERVYCAATGMNRGLLKYEADGTFSGFFGASRAAYDFKQYIWKKIASQEQLARMESFVPTEYDNVYMNEDGFIYVVSGSATKDDLRDDKADAVRLLNLLGNDILVKNGVYYDGKFPVYGDLYMGSGGGYEGPSRFTDITSFENEIYVCLDRNRGRLFGYDNQGRMIFICGGNGYMDGYFRTPAAIDHIGYDLFVLDSLDCSITVFTQTDFGKLVFDAIDQFSNGDYDQSKATWEEVITYDGNYDLAYIGIGRALLRAKDYKEALEYFELKYDDENWSKAYRQYRKIWVEEHIVAIVIIILALFLVPMSIGKVKSIKKEFETADIFK